MKMLDDIVEKQYKCIVFTYNVPHRKTYDTLTLLKAKGYRNVLVYAVPMHYKKKFVPLYEHRPKDMLSIHPNILSNNLGFDYYEGEGYDLFNEKTNLAILICGAGIIPELVVKNNTIINSHPGYIPYARGLDAMKWAIVEDKPIGVTTHLLGDEIDAGEIIDRCKVPIYKNDTFHALAQRVYEYEVKMLVEAIGLLPNHHEYIEAGNTILHKRMQADVEKDLMMKFEIYKEKYCEIA